MDAELKELKSVLRSLVVSSPSQVDVCSLVRDYRRMVGSHLPLAKYGYKEPVSFLRERCNDCFILHGASNNPTLTLIVPDTLKHIDKFVKSQKSNAAVKFKGKRRSVPGTITQPEPESETDLIARTFQKFHITKDTPQKSPDVNNENVEREYPKVNRNHNPMQSTPLLERDQIKVESSNNNKGFVNSSQTIDKVDKDHTEDNNRINQNTMRAIRKTPEKVKEVQNDHNAESSGNAVHNFLRKRMSLYNSSNCLDGGSSINGKSSVDDDSGRQTSSSNSLKKSMALEELKAQLVALVADREGPVACTDLLRLYRERYGRELNFGRFGFTSIVSLVVSTDALLTSRADDTSDWEVRAGGLPAPRPAPRARPAPRPAPRKPVDVDDALPGIDFDPDVFPVDCMHFMESIPQLSLGGIEPGALLDVMVAEVYSPSHFWLIRLGEQFHIAMDQMMDDMTEYYNSGPGRDRVLATGAVRMGHYCSSLFDRDWHRSLIVSIIDSETVKVRHVDYGTVDVVPSANLKPLLRHWASLPAQAIRARLAGVRPGAGGRRWPHAAAAHFLRRVRDQRLVASVVAADDQEDILEVFLVNTTTDKDECVSADLIRSGHADPRSDSSVRTSECYLFPKFAALESGATPNFAEIGEFLRNGIALDYVDDYRRHVPDCLPAAAPLAAPPAPLPDSSSSDSEAAPPAPAPPLGRIPWLPSSVSLPETERAGPAPAQGRSEPALLESPSPEPEPEPSPPPSPVSSPAPQEAPGPCGGVLLSAGECETFQMLSRADPVAAHWFMVGALSRAAPQLPSAGSVRDFRSSTHHFPQVAPPFPAPQFSHNGPQVPQIAPQVPQNAPQVPQNAPQVPHNAAQVPQNTQNAPQLPQNAAQVPQNAQNAPQFAQNAPQVPQNAAQVPHNAQNAPQFAQNAPSYQQSASQFRPNVSAAEFRPRATHYVSYPQPYAPFQPYPPPYPAMPFPPHFGPYVRPPGFRPPPGFGPC